MYEKLRTPDEPASPVTYRQILITFPVNADIERFFWGAVSAVSFHTAWVQAGTMSPEDAAFYIKDIVNSRRPFSMLGTVQAVFRAELDDSMLLCDGSTHNRADYPELWEVLPAAFKEEETLTVPNLRGLFLLGATEDEPQGSTGGEATVTLTVDEMPSHTHSYTTPTFNVDVEAPGAPDPFGVGNPQQPATTGSTGGDQAHNNMPPYMTVVYAMIAKVKP